MYSVAVREAPPWPTRALSLANSATSPRFFSVYNGTDTSGMLDVAPGYKADFPGTPGNCANCHAPTAVVPGMATPISETTSITGSISADMNAVTGVDAEGSFCEFCHKIGEVYLDPATGLPYDGRPGVLSTRLYRSPPGHVLWFGPFDDVSRRVSYLLGVSRLCVDVLFLYVTFSVSAFVSTRFTEINVRFRSQILNRMPRRAAWSAR